MYISCEYWVFTLFQVLLFGKKWIDPIHISSIDVFYFVQCAIFFAIRVNIISDSIFNISTSRILFDKISYLLIPTFWNIFVFDLQFVVYSMFTQITAYINVAVASWLDTTHTIYLNTVSCYLLSIPYNLKIVHKFLIDFLNNLLKWRCRLHQLYIIIPINIVVFENDELGKALICWKTNNVEIAISSRNTDT